MLKVFPEYENLFSIVFLTSSRLLLAHAVTAQEFANFDLGELTALLSAASQGRFDQEKAEAIQTVARQSIGIHFMADSVWIQMRCLLEQLDLLEAQRQEVDSMLEQLCNCHNILLLFQASAWLPVLPSSAKYAM